MGSTTTTTTPSSSVITTTTNLQVPFQLLEITLISAQDLSHVSKSMRTYAVAWVHPDRKLRSRLDQQGHANPTWNDKFVFRVDDKFLNSDTSAVMIEIYTQAWLRDTLVGTVRVLISNLIPPSTRSHNNTSTRFVALQVRRSSGSPQGILNMGVSLLDTTMRSMPLYAGSAVGYNDPVDPKMHGHYNQENFDDHVEDEKKQNINSKIQLWRSRSEGTDLSNEDFTMKSGSICNGSVINGSVVNGSDLYSDVGPSASVVAVAIAKGLYPVPAAPTKEIFKPPVAEDDAGSSIIEDLTIEEATAKGYKSKAANWQKRSPPLPIPHDNDSMIAIPTSTGRHSRRHSDGGGLFSCFGNAYGFEFTIVCGGNNNNNNNNNNDNNNNTSTMKNRKKKLGNTNKITDQNIPLPSRNSG